MAQPRFSAGERVSVVRSRAFTAAEGDYRILQALPMERGPQQYRVRSDKESFDRIVEEGRLEAAVVDA